MGNKNSSGSEPSLSNFSQRDDDGGGILSSTALPSRGHIFDNFTPSPNFPKRSATMSERHRISDVYVPEMPITRSGSDASSHRSPHHTQPLLPPSQGDSAPAITSDDLSKHIVEMSPSNGGEGVSLGSRVTVTFDKDVKMSTVQKLFEVSCDSIEPSMNPIKGQVSYDARSFKAIFTPLNTFLPNAQYTVILKGRAVTTTQCSQGANIKDTETHFKTCNPSPKNIGIKLKGDSESEQLQIASYYDLYNSLILWCTKKWGCSGEHITSIQSEKEGGKSMTIKGDLDVLNVNENEVIVVEIKD